MLRPDRPLRKSLSPQTFALPGDRRPAAWPGRKSCCSSHCVD
ncbi:hypothetical protein C4K40_2489 [Pseudomonas sp. CMR5c]|nr:hypothetical protein C4K40_2489 [Pseudomonas sp. CMR5c]